jgi:pilus assembly protein Flp/PilA
MTGSVQPLLGTVTEEFRHRSEEAEVLRLISKFAKDESGATAIEYALIACGISLAIIAAVQGLGSTLNGRYAAVNSSLK